MKVREVMTSNVSTLRDNSTIQDAANTMKNLNVGSIPVCDSANRPIGIVTDRDIVIRSVANGGDANRSLREVMTNNLVSVSPDTDIHEAARIMAQHQIRRLPIVENNNLVGMLSIGDLAVRDIYIDEAGDALSRISEPSRPTM